MQLPPRRPLPLPLRRPLVVAALLALAGCAEGSFTPSLVPVAPDAAHAMPPQALHGLDVARPNACEVQSVFAPLLTRTLARDAKGIPTRWIESWLVTDCGAPRTLRVEMIRGPGELRPIALVPGKGRARAALQEPAVLAVLQAIPQSDCRERMVVDSAIEGPPAPGATTWTEIWQVDACGKRERVRVTFRDDAAGPSFAIRSD